jgi:hypothetical protein
MKPLDSKDTRCLLEMDAMRDVAPHRLRMNLFTADPNLNRHGLLHPHIYRTHKFLSKTLYDKNRTVI